MSCHLQQARFVYLTDSGYHGKALPAEAFRFELDSKWPEVRRLRRKGDDHHRVEGLVLNRVGNDDGRARFAEFGRMDVLEIHPDDGAVRHG